MTAHPDRNGGSISRPPALSHPRLSLCMIVRDNARTIVPCLESIRPWVDEMIVVDTGSQDGTPEICRRLGAKVFSFPWIDDFAAARNESLRHASGEWLFWMDSDDTIDEANGRQLRQLAEGPHDPRVLGYVLQVHCPGPGDELTVVDHVKLFRNLAGLRFEGRIHEQVLGNLRGLRGEVGWSDIYVVHSGSDTSPAGKKAKVERDLRILQRDLQERPEHPFVLFNLGMTYHDLGDFAGAVHWLERCLKVSPAQQSHVRKAYALLVSSLTQLGRLEAATDACHAGRALFPQDAELLFRQGILASDLGEFSDAASAFRGAMRDQGERHFSSRDPGVAGHKARHNLALVLEQMGKRAEAELQWRLILATHPDFRPAWRGLGELLITEARHVTLSLEMAQRRNQPTLQAESLLLEAKLCQAHHQAFEAHSRLQEAVEKFADDPRCWERYSDLHMQAGELESAEASLLRLTNLAPEDGAAWHNLAVVLARLGKKGAAIDSFRKSLQVRPRASHTQQMLQQLLEEMRPALA